LSLATLKARSRTNSKRARDPLECYFRDIDETPLLSAEQEQELVQRIAEGDSAARDHLVRANLRLVVCIARRYQSNGVALDDLISEGNLGLLRAAEGFDPDAGVRFSTYASYWIKQSIKRGIINTGKTVRIPAYMTQLLIEWRRASARLQDELGRTPTPEEVAQQLGISRKKLQIIQKAIRIYNASPQAEASEAGETLGDSLVDVKTETAETSLVRADELHKVLGLLDQLDAREAQVLRLRFGLLGEDPKTLKEIGACLGLTRERVRQIESEALGKLSAAMEAA
jgi:RNA polymerase primary sigma factor